MDVGIPRPRGSRISGYTPPANIQRLSLNEALARGQRAPLARRQMDLLHGSQGHSDVAIYCTGDLGLLSYPAVSIVGTRDASDDGKMRAKRLARELAVIGVVIVSGLARGIDTSAHSGAIEAGGRTIAVIGTPLDKAYPAENATLQEDIYNRHLLVSPFKEGESTFKASFPKRNRVMAAMSDATVIVEASDTSGTLHQAAECQRLERWLFIMKSVAEDSTLTWPRKFIGKPKVEILTSTQDVIDAINA